MPVRIIVCGGRHYADRQAVFRVLDRIHTERSVAEVIQGECPTGAGPLRNREMLTTKPDGVVAFPGDRGTRDMISAAREAGVPVYIPFPF